MVSEEWKGMTSVIQKIERWAREWALAANKCSWSPVGMIAGHHPDYFSSREGSDGKIGILVDQVFSHAICQAKSSAIWHILKSEELKQVQMAILDSGSWEESFRVHEYCCGGKKYISIERENGAWLWHVFNSNYQVVGCNNCTELVDAMKNSLEFARVMLPHLGRVDEQRPKLSGA